MMDFNPRTSQQFRAGGMNSNYRGTGTGRKKEEDSDSFMRLPDKEIAGCISDIGVPFTPADLQKPNPQQIQMVFEWFAELLMNITRDTVDPAMKAASEDICGEFGDVIPGETRSLMAFFISLRKLMLECGITDFSFQDLFKPTHDRLVKIFSYVINFVRFRESQTSTIDEHFNKSERTKARIETLFRENEEMEGRLAEMRRNRKGMEAEVKEKMRRNDELKTRLLELRKGQERVAERLERVRGDKGRLTNALEEKTAMAINVRHESAKLKPYVLQSPAALQASLADLSNSLAADKAQIDGLDRRTRALQTSTDTFGVVANDVAACIKLLEELSVELHREEEEAQKAARHRDALSERGNNVREVERTEHLLNRQLQRWNERTEALRQGSREKARQAKERMEELRKVHRELTEERGEKGRDMERRRVRIEQTEKKMADLKENIENEIHSAYDQYLKLDSHIKLYITEMEQSIV
ncbi:kinetochore protein nuf2 [Xylona heveae TC161]|uniref:Probable kinetochore protein NUF2 n=1 Tax=Xylona heveae (strain CBS 132557 / TC161) TaxID=1328760 RepID=A0A165HAI1_XYLHT|nr:kinetochore protein nuf2 [Xylona heveae TC161]KZF23214.1 kinetochore protein nuf2 [Xylona heveae TC161]